MLGVLTDRNGNGQHRHGDVAPQQGELAARW